MSITTSGIGFLTAAPPKVVLPPTDLRSRSFTLSFRVVSFFVKLKRQFRLCVLPPGSREVGIVFPVNDVVQHAEGQIDHLLLVRIGSQIGVSRSDFVPIHC